MIVEALLTVLADADLGVEGETLFAHRMDFETEEGVMVRLPLEGVPIDWNIPGYYKTPVQAIVRAKDQQTGDALAKQVSRALTIYKRKIGDVTIKQLVPVRLPIVYPRSDGQNLEWSINLDCAFGWAG